MSMLPFVRRRPAPALLTPATPDILQPRSAPQTSGPIIECTDIVRTFHLHGNAVHALKGVSLEVQPGTMVALRGRSGSGKTTLLNIMGGLDRPTTGSVNIEGREIGHLSDGAMTDLRRRKMAFVFQSYALLPVLSALENVELAMRIARMPRKGREQRTRPGQRPAHHPCRRAHRRAGQRHRPAGTQALPQDRDRPRRHRRHRHPRPHHQRDRPRDVPDPGRTIGTDVGQRHPPIRDTDAALPSMSKRS
jgi:ABC-type glutathione transport system ATPase component